MGRINVDHVEPDMVLASDLIHSNGRFLLGRGVILDPLRLRILKIWGVQSVEVEGSSDEIKSLLEDRIDPSILQTAEDWTKRRFSRSNLEHPFMQELFHICAVRKAREIIQTPEGMEPWLDSVPVTQPDSNVTPVCSMGLIELETLVDEEPRLASLPTIFMEISEAIGDPRSSSVHVANVIGKDTSLSAKLLKIVNSAFYNFPYKIDTISRAVTIIGSRQLSSLALGASVLRSFQGIPEDLVDMESFWKHSITCGISARMIASFKNIPNTERLLVAGLLHDIGRIILYQRVPDLMSSILLQAKETHRFLRSMEAEALGVDHAHVGGMLLKKWKFPLAMEQAVAYHHDPLKSPHFLEASILYLSDILANALEMGTSGDCLVSPLIPEVWDSLGLEKEAFTQIVQLIERQVEEIIHHFFDQR